MRPKECRFSFNFSSHIFVIFILIQLIEEQNAQVTYLNEPISTIPGGTLFRPHVNNAVTPNDIYAYNETLRPPTNSWWMNLVMQGGTGFYDLTVVSEPSNITDATKQISIQECESLGINATIGEVLQVTRDVFDPNVNQGCYYTMASPVGFRFCNQETFTNDSSQYTADRNWSFQVSCVETLAFNPATPPSSPSEWSFKAIDWSTLSVVLQYITLPGSGAINIPLVRYHAFQTFQYTGTVTPAFIVTGAESLQSITSLTGGGNTGTQFEITITDGSIWILFASSTITFSTGCYVNYQVIPDGEPMPPNPPNFQYIFYSDAQTLNPPIPNLKVGFEYQYYLGASPPSGFFLNSFFSPSPFQGIIRVAKIPNEFVGTSQQSTILGYLQSYYSAIPYYGEANAIQWTSDTSMIGFELDYNYVIDMEGTPSFSTVLMAYPPLLISQLQSPSSLGTSLQSLRGTLTYVTGTKFQFEVTPPEDEYFNNEVLIRAGVNQLTSNDISTLIGQLQYDLQFTNVTTYYDSYNGGKELLCMAEISLFLAKTLSDQGNYTTSEIYNEISEGFIRLKNSMTLWMNGTSFFYDTSWGGIIDYWGLFNPDQDYSNIMYQDHNFHYGYFVQAAAVVAFLDATYSPSTVTPWINLPARGGGTMADLIDCLLRDVANPSSSDPSFPTWRSMDWEEGHSRPMGIFPTGSGGNEESTAEDENFYFGMMMWGKYSGNNQTYLLGKVMTSRVAIAAKYYWQVGSSVTIYEGSQSTPPSEPPSGVNDFPAVGILWDDKVDPNTWFLGTDYCEVGIQSIARFPYLLTTLEDSQWEERMVTYWMNPSTDSDLWHIWTIPSNQSEWYSILLPALATQYPSGARVVWNDPRCGFDSGNTRGTILWTILYNQAAGPIDSGPYPPLAPVSTGYPPPEGYAASVYQDYENLIGPEGPIVAYTGDLNDTATFSESITTVKNNSMIMGLDPRNYPTPADWANLSTTYLSMYNTFNAAYDAEVNATENLPENQKLSSWQSFAEEWGLYVNDTVEAIQNECVRVLDDLNLYSNLCVQNENALNAILERVALQSCLLLLNTLADELLDLSNQKNPPPNRFELAIWAIQTLNDPDFNRTYPALGANDAGKSCVETFCGFSGIPTPPKYQTGNTTIAVDAGSSYDASDDQGSNSDNARDFGGLGSGGSGSGFGNANSDFYSEDSRRDRWFYYHDD